MPTTSPPPHLPDDPSFLVLREGILLNLRSVVLHQGTVVDFLLELHNM